MCESMSVKPTNWIWLNLRVRSSVGTNSSEINQREVVKRLALNAKEAEVYLLGNKRYYRLISKGENVKAGAYGLLTCVNSYLFNKEQNNFYNRSQWK